MIELQSDKLRGRLRGFYAVLLAWPPPLPLPYALIGAIIGEMRLQVALAAAF